MFSRKFAFGAVRSRRIVVRLYFDQLQAFEVGFDIQSASGTARLRKRWPSDFKVQEDVLGRAHFVGEADLGEVSDADPLIELKILDDQDVPVEYGRDFSLHTLFARSPQEFRVGFFRIGNRPKDAETLTFACRQILTHYHFDVSHRVVAGVIYGYRAIDSCDRQMLLEASAWLEEALAFGMKGGRVNNHRTNKDHLMISAAMVLTLMYMALSDRRQTMRCLEQTVNFIRTLHEPFALQAYNGCRLVLLYAFLLYKEGKHERALELFEYNFEFYKRCLVRIEPKADVFGEMQEAHHAVWLGLLQISNHEKGLVSIESTKVFDAVNRVRSEKGRALLLDRYLHFLKRIRIGARATN